MIIRNCLELLSELAELEKLMEDHKKTASNNCSDADLDEILINVIQNHLRKKR